MKYHCINFLLFCTIYSPFYMVATFRNNHILHHVIPVLNTFKINSETYEGIFSALNRLFEVRRMENDSYNIFSMLEC